MYVRIVKEHYIRSYMRKESLYIRIIHLCATSAHNYRALTVTVEDETVGRNSAISSLLVN